MWLFTVGYLGNFAVHLFSIFIIHICNDACDGGPHLLDGANMSAVGWAKSSSKRWGLWLTLLIGDGRVLELGNSHNCRLYVCKIPLPCWVESAVLGHQSWSAARQSSAGAEIQRETQVRIINITMASVLIHTETTRPEFRDIMTIKQWKEISASSSHAHIEPQK